MQKSLESSSFDNIFAEKKYILRAIEFWGIVITIINKEDVEKKWSIDAFFIFSSIVDHKSGNTGKCILSMTHVQHSGFFCFFS